MSHTPSRERWVISWVLFTVLLFLVIDNSRDLGATSMNKIKGSVWYRELYYLPPMRRSALS